MPIQEVVKRHPLTSTKVHHRAKNKQFSTLRCTKTGSTQPKLSAACFVVQSCLADADFVVFSNYCLIGTRPRVLLFCLKRQIAALCTKCLLVIIIAGICTIIMAKYRSKKVHRLPSAAFCRMRSLGVERKCWFSTNCPCICCLFVVFLIASKRFVVCIWGIACR